MRVGRVRRVRPALSDVQVYTWVWEHLHETFVPKDAPATSTYFPLPKWDGLEEEKKVCPAPPRALC